MRYDKDTITAVRRAFEQRRAAAQDALERRRAEAYQKAPELRSVEREIARVSALAAAQALRQGEAGLAAERVDEAAHELRGRRLALLREAGYAPDFLEPRYECPRCEDTGYTGAAQCDCYVRALREQALRGSVLYPLVGAHRFDNFELSLYSAETDPDFGISPRANMERVARFMRRFAESFPDDRGGIMLQGYTGLGKTHLSLAVAGELIRRGFHVEYGATSELIGIMEDARFRPGDGAARRAADLAACDLLIMDDLGSEFCTAFTQAAVFDIINARTTAGRPMIISTNCTMRELRDIYTDKTVSRIVGALRLITVFGEDIRQRIADSR